MIWNSWPMEVIGREGIVGKDGKKGFWASLLQPQQKEKLSCVLITISFVTPYKKSCLKFVVHVNNPENRLPWYIHRSTPESVCAAISATVLWLCCSTTLPTANWKTELKGKHIKVVLFIQQCLLRDTGGLDFVTIKFEKIKYHNWKNTEADCKFFCVKDLICQELKEIFFVFNEKT